MKIVFKIAILAGALCFQAAQAGQMTLYTDVNFGGRAVTVHDAMPDLSAIGFNDRASSMVIDSGRWEVCVDAGFRGHCALFERGEYPRIERFNDTISSVREAGGSGHESDHDRDHDHDRDRSRGGDPDRGGRQWRGDSESRAMVLLYSRPNFGGEPLSLLRDARNLSEFNFNDQAASIVVQQGEWEMCMHADFGGQCRIYGPGQYPRLGFLDGQISSLRRLR